MFKKVVPIVFAVTLVLTAACAKKVSTKPVNPKKPVASTSPSAPEAAFNGEWITDCLPVGDGSFKVTYYNFNDGGVFKETAKYSDNQCSNMTTVSEIEGYFVIDGDAASIEGAKNVNVTLGTFTSYDMWFKDGNTIFLGLRDDAHHAQDAEHRPVDIDVLLYPYNG